MRRSDNRTDPAFTLIEALVSVAILAGMLLMLASIFRQATQVVGQVRGGLLAQQTARNVFSAIDQDLAGLCREGFLFIRTQQLPISIEPRSGLILYYDEDGQPVRLNNGRFDVMVMTTSGYQSSADAGGGVANFARVIWAQTERATGNNRSDAPTSPKYWGEYLVLSRDQTLMLPDALSPQLSNENYAAAGGRQRGPDYFNMTLCDLNAAFDEAMGPSGVASMGLFSTLSKGGELLPDQRSSLAWRLGRSGPGPLGPGQPGGGDLTPGQVAANSLHGHERPKVFGPEDYHRIAAFGVASFQVDWSDGTRHHSGDSQGMLQFYPESSPVTQDIFSDSQIGPGEKRAWCWNSQTPTSLRDNILRRSFPGVLYDRRYWGYATDPPNWRDINNFTNATWNISRGSGSGGAHLALVGWPWPRAIRVRLLILDTTQDPPVGYGFEQIFYVLVR